MAWDLSCPDWEARLRAGRSPFRDLPLDQAAGARAVAVFDKLKLADVPGTPRLGAVLPTDPPEQTGDAAGDWFRAIVRALFGSMDPITRERFIREVFVLVPKKNSKALALDTLIATPDGFTTMGDVRQGDVIFDVDGRPTRVVAKSDVFVGRRCYEVEFSTGERVVCDEQHLWVTDAHTDRERQHRSKRKCPCPTAKTTGEIAASLRVKSGRLLINNHRTVLAGALDLPCRADLAIPPYVLGAWLGDGNTKGAAITAGADDARHIVERIAAAGHPVRLARHDPRTGAATISIASEPGNRPGIYRFRTQAIQLGVWGNKHIPASYLRASRSQRLELLRGLMDTDGSISRAGQASYTTTSQSLRDGVVELIASLGFKPTWSEHRAKLNGMDCGPVWRIQFWPLAGVPVFTMPRKLERQRTRADRSMASRSMTRQIVAVREVPSVPTQCIAVESASEQFLVTRSLLPTHNTSYGALLMLVALLLNQRPHAPFILTAPVQDTADLAFSQAAGAIALDPVLEKKLLVREHLKTIVHRETKAELQIMTFDPSVLTGQKPVGVLIDEMHVIAKMAKAASALRQLRGGMLPFAEAFLVTITTQSEEEPVGIFKAELTKARNVRDGLLQAPILPVLYEFPEAMQKDPARPWKDPAVWHMVTPNAGRSISIARLTEDARIAETTSEAEFRAWASQHLNIQIGVALQTNAWAGARAWEAAALPSRLTLEDLLDRSEVVEIGADGGGNDDLLGLTVLGRERGTGHWLWWSHAWINPPALEQRKSEVTKYQDLAAAGDLTICEDVGTDMTEFGDIAEQVLVSGLLDKVGIDPSGVGSIVDELVKRGVPEDSIVGISQGWRLTGAIKTTERKLSSGLLRHGGQALMNWCVGNARVVQAGNAILITKQVSGTAKIDPLMAGFNAVSLLSMNPASRVFGEDYELVTT